MKNREDFLPLPEEIYKHFKGGLYQIITVCTHTETGETLVVYRALYGDFKSYARPLSLFLSPVDKEKYPDSAEVYRFTKLSPGKEEKMTSVTDSSHTKVSDSAPFTAPPSFSPEERAQALFMEFLDETDFEKKRNILRAVAPIASESMVNSMAVSLDLVPTGISRDADIKMISDYISARIHFDGSGRR